MTFISAKTIHGKKRHYLEKSVRLLNGRVKKYSLYLKTYDPKATQRGMEQYKARLEEKIAEDIANVAAKHYQRNPIFNDGTLRRLEQIKMGYKKILKKITKTQLSDILDRFTINFTYESNAIEGNSLTLKEVTFIIQEGKILKGKDLREIYETLNTRKAIEWIFNKKPRITEKNIIKLHEILVRDTGITTGYKRLPNFLMGRVVKTTPPEQVAEDMRKLLQWYDDSKALHPLQRAALFHGQLEKIHPFEDGNGRVGRLLINMTLLNEGYPPLIIRKSHRVAYFHALAASDNSHMDTLYRFLLEKYKDTYEKFFKVYVQYLPLM